MKKLFLIALIVVLIVSAVCGGIYWYWQSYEATKVENASEAKDLFELSKKGILVLGPGQLDKIKEQLATSGKLYVPISDLTLSEVNPIDGGYIINAYSVLKPVCLEEYYSYTFLVSNEGLITKQSEKLIWESTTKPACIN